MDIPKTLIEVISSIPELIDENTIEIIQTEKWEILKSNLLTTKESIQNHINSGQNVLDEINQYLSMFGEEPEPEPEGEDNMAIYSRKPDPQYHDFDINNLIDDGAWHDLDCSNIVPEGATHIYFSCGVRSDTPGKYFWLRTKGFQYNHMALILCTLSTNPNLVVYGRQFVECDENRKVECKITAGITAFHCDIIGWQK